MPAGLFTGLLKGFNETSAAGRTEARHQEDLQAQREQTMLSSLVGADDPDISAAAVSALAEIAGGAPRPKGGFLQRIVGGGSAAVHPALKPIIDLLHTPGALDVILGRAQAGGGGATPSAAASPAGGAAASAGGPPAVAPPTPPQAGSAEVPAGPLTAGGPPSVSALGTPGGGAPAAGGGTQIPARTAIPPANVNTPPQADRAAAATSAPAVSTPATPIGGGPPQVGLPIQGVQSPTFNRSVFLPPEERQRQTLQLHAQGIEMDLNSRVNAALRVWDSTNPNASPEDRKNAHDQILEKELGTAPRWANVPGTVTGDKLPPGTVDMTGAVIVPGSVGPNDHFVLQQAGSRVRAVPTTGPKQTHTYKSVSWPPNDPTGKPALVEVMPDQTMRFVAYQSSRDFTATVTHADGSQELVLVPAQFSAGSQPGGGGGVPGGPPQVSAPGGGTVTPPSAPGAGGPPQVTGPGPTPGPQSVLRTKDAIPVDATAHSKRTHDGDFYVNLPATGLDQTQRRRLGEDAAKHGWPVLDAAEASIVDDVSTSLENMDQVEKSILPKLPTDASGKFLGDGLQNQISAFLQTDPELASYNTWRSMAVRALRGMAGSKSFRMNQKEIDLAIKNDIPEITDTVATALDKMNKVRLLLRNTTDNVLSRGIPPEAYQIAPGYKRLINGIYWAMPKEGGRPRNLGAGGK